MPHVLTEQRSYGSWDSMANAPGVPVIVAHFRCSACPYDSINRVYVETHVTGPHQAEAPESPPRKKGDR